MKIKKITKYKNKLLKFKLIQKKIYTKKQYLNNIKMEDIEYRLKKILYVIYKYHIYNKKILFIGSPVTFNYQIKNLLKLTQHALIPKNIWVRGAISNKQSCFKHLSKNKKTLNNKISKILSQLKKDIDLIVILEESNNSPVLNEGYVTRIPVISINYDLNIHDAKTSYKMPGNFKFTNKKIPDNFFYSLLVATLKRGNNYVNYLKKTHNSNLYNQKPFYKNIRKK